MIFPNRWDSSMLKQKWPYQMNCKSFVYLNAQDANKRSAQKIERIFIVQNAIGKQHYFLGISPSPSSLFN